MPASLHFAERCYHLGMWLEKMARAVAAFALVSTTVVVAGSSVAGANSPLVSQPITDRGVTLELVPLVELPNTDRGAARINQFATIDDRLFVVEDHTGKIYEIERDGLTATATEFFDVGAAIPAATGRQMNLENAFHGGLRGVAFHPEFASNGLFYTTVMEDRPNTPNPTEYLSDAVDPISADGVLIEWEADVETGSVDPNSYRQVFRVGMPVFEHPIKQLAFNPFSEPGDEDYGLLYVAHGDGSVLSATAGGGINNDALGKILRVDPAASGSRGWTVPANNPFVGDSSMIDEAYSIGHRNPHHLSFAEDAAGDVHLLAVDVGRDNVEEVNVITPGSNYGWSEREGTFVHLDDGEGLVTGVAPLPENDAENDFVYPAVQFGHQGEPGAGFGGQAIAGGFVVDNGSELSGEYFFSDFPLDGDIYHSTFTDISASVTELAPGDSPDALTQAEISTVAVTFDHDADPETPPLSRQHPRGVFDDSLNYVGSGRADVRIGQGPDGEMYVSSKRNGGIYLVANSLPVEEKPDDESDEEIAAPVPTTPQTCRGLEPTVDGLIGTEGDDVIIGTGVRDVIQGLGGDDLICAFGGADQVDAGPGDDVVYGGWGADVIRMGLGDDQVFAGPGLDDIEGGGGNDILRGGNGGDRIVGNSGNDMLYGGDRRDRIFGFSGNDQLFGGAGTDNLRGGAGIDSATGGAGVDLCVTSESLIGCERS